MNLIPNALICYSKVTVPMYITGNLGHESDKPGDDTLTIAGPEAELLLDPRRHVAAPESTGGSGTGVRQGHSARTRKRGILEKPGLCAARVTAPRRGVGKLPASSRKTGTGGRYIKGRGQLGWEKLGDSF